MCLGLEQHWPASLSGFQLLATVLSQKPVSDSSPGDSPVKPPEGPAGKAKETVLLAGCGGGPWAALLTLSSLGATRAQPPAAHVGPGYGEQPPKKLEAVSEGKVQGQGG